MSEYLVFVIGVSFFFALASSFLDESGATNTAKTVIRIIAIFLVVAPIIKTAQNFLNTEALPVINEENNHIINSENEDIKTYREWIADLTASELEKDITLSINEQLGLDTRVECSWHFEEDNVIFEVIKVYTKSSEKSHETIKNFISLHYSLDSVIIKEGK